MVRISDHWYLAVAGRQPEGPYQEKDIIKSLKDGKLSWVIFACNPAMDMPWRRIIDIEHFRDYLPQEPTLTLYQELVSDFKGKSYVGGKPPLPDDKWYLQCNGSQFGPMTKEEVLLLMKQTAFKTKMFAWKQGLQGWIPAEQVPELKIITDRLNQASANLNSDKRKHKRVKLLASVTLAVDDDRIDDVQGICRDISVGGLFVVTDNLLPLNSAVTIMVSPVANPDVKAFKATGYVVSIGREQTGMAIQFTSLPKETKAELEAYASMQED